jgi:mannose-6-phosphate isomerase-like protein (cupin superfamily)
VGKSVFVSIDTTPRVVRFERRKDLVFWEMYATDAVPAVTGHEPDPVLNMRSFVPGPEGSRFRLVQFPPRPPEGSQPPAGWWQRFLEEYREKVPGLAEHFEEDVPGMHTTATIDYGVVVRGEIILELDDGKTAHLRQGDCVVQNGTRHRWRNPLPEPCLMAFIMVGGQQS